MRRKEQEMIRRIYEENKEKIRWYLWKHYGWLSREDVFDIMQDTWKAMCEHIEEIAESSEAEQWRWITTVVRSKVVSMIRSNARDERLTEKVQENIGESSVFPPAEETAVQKMTAEGILERLSPREREVLFDEYLKPSLLTEETARSNAENCRSYRARKKLQTYMKEGGIDE